MSVFRLSILSIFVFLMTGCGNKVDPDAGLLSYTSVIPLEKANKALMEAMPISRRATFGSFTINSAAIKPGQSGDRVALLTNFGLTTFEIPEGVNGSLAASCGLRYDQQTKQIFLTDIRPAGMKVNNPSLSEYVSKGAKRGIKSIISKVFRDIPIYKMDKSFTAKFIKKVTVHKGNIVVIYGL